MGQAWRSGVVTLLLVSADFLRRGLPEVWSSGHGSRLSIQRFPRIEPIRARIGRTAKCFSSFQLSKRTRGSLATMFQRCQKDSFTINRQRENENLSVLQI